MRLDKEVKDAKSHRLGKKSTALFATLNNKNDELVNKYQTPSIKLDPELKKHRSDIPNRQLRTEETLP